MHCVLLQQMLLALVLTLSNPFANSPTELITALPITSKPIESTVENLAWQAWIMLPPQQQNLEKSRKVTPKSIFILPNRVKLPPPTNTNGFAADGSQFLTGEIGSGYAPLDCPPGQRQFESRCIPTVDIDREQLLIQELQILLQQGGGGGGSNQGGLEYDYDYDDDSKPMVGNFEPPSMSNGGKPPILIGNNYDDSDRLPVEDAPLKFNIFREKFPTDGASAAENSNEKSAIFDPMATVENGAASEGWKAVNITELLTDLANKMQMENDDDAAGPFFPADLNRSPETPKEEISLSSITTTTAASATISKVNSSQGFALSDIDAIMLPAAAATTTQSHQQQHHHHHHHEQQQHQNSQQQFAIFKDDSAMQLLAVDQKHDDDRRSSLAQQQKTTEIMELLKVDALMPLNNIATGITVTRSTVTPLPFLDINAVHKDTHDAVTEAMTTTTTTTTFPTPLAEILTEVKAHASQEHQKPERTRSVTLHMLDDDLTTTNEIESDPLATTTTETGDVPSTTIIDEMSIDAVPNSNDAALLQLDETIAEDPIEEEIVAVTEQEDPAKRLNDFSAAHEVRKKSKVEPVGIELLNAADDVDDDEQTTPLPTPPEFEKLIPAEVDSVNALTNVAAVADFNRFTEKNTVTVVGAAALNNEVSSVESKTATPTTTTTAVNMATKIKSEIDIATELRIINELVKGKRQGTPSISTTKTTTATKPRSTESTLATPTILTTTTTTTKSNTPPIKNSNDLKQETTATSVKTLPTTIKNDYVETTTTSWILNAKSGTTPSHKSSVESGNIVTDTKAELNSKSNSSPTTTTTTESTATLWSKILPFLSFGSTTTATTTPVPADAALSSADSSVENSSNLRSNSSLNRRNSKIIRINNLSTNVLSEAESSKIATTTTVAAVSSTTTTTTTTELPLTETTTTSTITRDDTSSSSFWWLPIGWSSESTDAEPAVTSFRTHKNAVTPVASAAQPQSLLLRFWNAFPGNQKRS